MSSILIKNGLVVEEDRTGKKDILVEGQKISRVSESIAPEACPPGTEVVDATGLMVLPGLIDAHTHYHLVSRGTVTADSFKEGSRLASFGGVTTVVDFADDDRVSLPGSLSSRKEEMKDMAIDYTLHQGVYRYRDTLPQELAEIKAKGAGTVKIFTTYKREGYLVDDRSELSRIFGMCRDLGLMVTVHCEDDKVITEINDHWEGGHTPADHAEMRPPRAEAEAIRYVGGIALEQKMPVYIVHLSSREGLEAVREMRGKGCRMYVETTPHYLFLDKTKLQGDKGPLYVMTPPLRTEDDNKALQEALLGGEIQVVATDHCSFTYEQKLQSHDCRTIFPGIPGTEELLPMVNTFAARNGMAMEKVVSLLSTGPAKLFGIYPEKGSLQEGTDADLVLFDPEESWTLTKASVHSASGYTPYEGMEVKGRVVETILRGSVVVKDGVYSGKPQDGRYLDVER